MILKNKSEKQFCFSKTNFASKNPQAFFGISCFSSARIASQVQVKNHSSRKTNTRFVFFVGIVGHVFPHLKGEVIQLLCHFVLCKMKISNFNAINKLGWLTPQSLARSVWEVLSNRTLLPQEHFVHPNWVEWPVDLLYIQFDLRATECLVGYLKKFRTGWKAFPSLSMKNLPFPSLSQR